MADGFKPVIISLILVGFFAVALLNAMIMIGDQNDFPASVADDPSISAFRSNITSQIQNVSTSTGTADDVLGNSSITTSLSTPFVDSLGGIWKLVRSAPINIWNATVGLAAERLFGDSKYIVLTVLGAIILIILIFAVVRLIATGDAR